MVRDISRANGKEIRLDINGEKTELDKRMIDELGDPLIHLVRNSADHGIESPEDREAAGKPPPGPVTLDAFHRGNSIVIQVSDDGKGLDADRILRKALEKGLVTEADARADDPQQIYQLIWEPGLSTAEKVTDVSGRGMGMDIVKSKIEELNGTVELDSEPGQGTTITIKLPLTLAILPSPDGRDRRRRLRHADGIGGGDRQRPCRTSCHGARPAHGQRPRPRDLRGEARRRARASTDRRRGTTGRPRRKRPWWSSANAGAKSAWRSIA